jgi:hypothetical protein
MFSPLRLLALVLVLPLLSPTVLLAATGDGTPQDANLLYVGRWDRTNASAPRSYWGGAYIRTGFTGTSLSAKLGKAVDLAVFIDDKPAVIKRGANGTVSLASGLAAGNHTIKLVARFEADEIVFQGFVLSAGAKTLPAEPSKGLIEFVGNSITSGSVTTNGNISAFAWLTGEALGVDRTAISFPGITLTAGYSYTFNGAPTIGHEIQYFKLTTPPRYPSKTPANNTDWDFSRYTPDMVVLNIGTNDKLVPVPSATFKASYIKTLKAIRAKLPKTRIFVMRPYGGHFATEIEAAYKEVANAGDTKLHFINTTGWLVTSDYASDGLHPHDAGQIKVSAKLAQVLKPYVDGLPSAVASRSRPESTASIQRLDARKGLRLGYSVQGRNFPRSSNVAPWKAEPAK